MPSPEKSPVVLILEDDFILAQDYKAHLEALGFEVHLAQHSVEAIEECRVRAIDVVVADIFIKDSGINTGKGGADFLVQLRNCDPDVLTTSKSVPVLVISGDPLAKLAPGGIFAAALALGATDTLARPFEMDALVSKLKDLLA